MKLLTTIAAILISISAFSQDYVEYNESTYSLNGEIVLLEYKSTMTGFNSNAESMFELSLGTFTQNGEELSMEQIYDLAVLHKVGRSNVRRANRFDRMHKDRNLRISNNGLNFIGGAATGYVGGIGVWLSYILIYGEYLSAAAIVIVPTTVLCAVSCAAFSRITFREGCLRKRDKQFNKVADKINQAIVRAGQTVQSSNQ